VSRIKHAAVGAGFNNRGGFGKREKDPIALPQGGGTKKRKKSPASGGQEQIKIFLLLNGEKKRVLPLESSLPEMRKE